MKTKGQIIALAVAGILVTSAAIFAAVPQSSESKSRVLTIMSNRKPIAEMTLGFPAARSGNYPVLQADHCMFNKGTQTFTLSGHASISAHGVDQNDFAIKGDEIVIHDESAK